MAPERDPAEHQADAIGGAIGGELAGIGAIAAGPLPANVRAVAEKHVGVELGEVELRSDSSAARRAADLQALAVTEGSRVSFASNRLSTGSVAARALLGHELTHVAQQQVHRSPRAPQLAPDPSSRDATSAESNRELAIAARVLRGVPKLSDAERGRLDDLVGKSGVYHLIKQAEDLRRELEGAEATLKDWQSRPSLDPADAGVGSDDIAGAPASQEQIAQQSALVQQLTSQLELLDTSIDVSLKELHLSVTDRSTLVEQIETEFPQLWKERAKAIALNLLQHNREALLLERERFPPQSSPDVALLRSDDALLLILANQAERARKAYYQAQAEPKTFDKMVSPDLAFPLRAKVLPALNEYGRAKNEYSVSLAQAAAQNPILLHPGYTPGMFQAVTDEELVAGTGSLVDDVLENIADTEENIKDDDISVWHMPVIRNAAFLNLGVPQESILGQVVQRQFEQTEQDEETLQNALQVIGMGATLAATAVNPLLGAAVGAAFGVIQLAHSAGEYVAEDAAQLTALDPEIADLSEKDPDLLWVVLDAISLGLDAAMIVKELGPAARALMRTGEIGEFAAGAEKLGAHELVDRASRRFALKGGAAEEFKGVLKGSLEGGHTLTISPTGWWLCSADPCFDFTLIYLVPLARDQALRVELTEIRAALVAAGSRREANKVLARAVRLEAKLRATLRFHRGTSSVVDLAAHEGGAIGAHTLSKHVNVDEAFLLQRLKDEGIDLASKFVDEKTANRAVGAALEANPELLNRFLGNPTQTATGLDLSFGNEVIGYGKLATGGPLVPLSKVHVELRKDALMADGYRILTAYPVD